MNNRNLLFIDNLCLSPRCLDVRTLVLVSTPDLRLMRYFVAVAERGSFTGAAQELHVAQQAVSQQIRALEQLLGVTLLARTSRRVTLTPEGAVFLTDCRRVLAGADRAAQRVRAAARGEAGTLRLVYSLVSAFETVPVLLARLGEDYPLLKVEAREVFGSDVAGLLGEGRCDVALAPSTSYGAEMRQRTLRREVIRLAVGERHRLAGSEQVELDSNIAQGRGIGLVVSSLIEQLPHGVALVDLAPPSPMLTVNAVWRHDQEIPAIERFFDTAKRLTRERHWA
jgi:DNA-binding transcriptional LysR family regulator